MLVLIWHYLVNQAITWIRISGDGDHVAEPGLVRLQHIASAYIYLWLICVLPLSYIALINIHTQMQLKIYINASKQDWNILIAQSLGVSQSRPKPLIGIYSQSYL